MALDRLRVEPHLFCDLSVVKSAGEKRQYFFLALGQSFLHEQFYISRSLKMEWKVIGSSYIVVHLKVGITRGGFSPLTA